MRRIACKLIATVALGLGTVQIASAADLPLRVPPAVASAYSWGGCYAGVHVGGGWEASSWTSSGVTSGAGVVGGGQIGCNGQWRQLVLGLEGEFWGSSLSDRNSFRDSTETSDSHAHNRWDGAISVRSGVAFDRAFIYGKLGAVLGKFDYDQSFSFLSQSSTTQGSKTFPGVLIGVGFEYAFTDNWTAKFEYNYIDFGNQVVAFAETSCNPGCIASTFSETVKETKQIAKIGLNYKFGGF
jgi:outer membrane immunogenic protein